MCTAKRSFAHVALALAILVVITLPAAGATHFVSASISSFTPQNLLILVGDTVVWTNEDAFGFHTVTSGAPCSANGQFNSGSLMPEGGQFSFTFTSAGSIDYFCAFHCLGGMTGNVTVQAPTPVGTPAPTATLGQNFPNPFNPTTTIAYTLPSRMRAVLSIHDSQGALVIRLDQGVREAGMHRIEWDGRDVSGASVGSGVYFYRLEGIDGVAPRKMVLLK